MKLFLLLFPLCLWAADYKFEKSMKVKVRGMRDQKVPEKQIRCYEGARNKEDAKKCDEQFKKKEAKKND